MPMSWEKIAARESYADSIYLNSNGDIEIGQPAVDQVLQPFIFLSPDQQARFKQGWRQGQADGYDPVERTSWKGIL